MKLLVVDCCIRGEESATRQLYEAWLSKAYPAWAAGTAKPAACDAQHSAAPGASDAPVIERMYLTEENLSPLTAADVERRSALVAASGGLWNPAAASSEPAAFNNPMFRFAKQFASADEILIAAPYWDWSFPSLLKVYIENVSVSGITFIYRGPDPTGLCKAKRIRYFSTCGGFTHGHHQGVSYIREVAEAFGIPEVAEYTVEGLDAEPGKREHILKEAINRLLMEGN